MTKEEILNSNLSKTKKMQMLFELGFTRSQVSQLMGVGYGFVQNVFAQTYPEKIRRRTFAEMIEDAIYRVNDFVFNLKFGVEIEAYGVEINNLMQALTAEGISVNAEAYNHITRDNWKIVSDSSITGKYPFELVSPVLEGQDGLNQLQRVCRALKNKRAKVNKTCGLHIHFDTSNFTKKTWKNLLINYAELEIIIDSFMPESRRANNAYYAKSIRVENIKEKIASVNGRDISEMLTKIKNTLNLHSRFFKINIESYWRHRTVEFRQHSGTIEFDKISNWILFLARLVDYSKTTKIDQADDSTLVKFLPGELISYIENRRIQLA